MKALGRLYEGSMKLYEGSTKALVRLYRHDYRAVARETEEVDSSS